MTPLEAQRWPERHFEALMLVAPAIHWLSRSPHGIVIVSSPQYCKQILRDNGSHFSKGPIPFPARLLLGDGTACSWFSFEPHNNKGSVSSLEHWRIRKNTLVSHHLAARRAVPLSDLEELADRISSQWRSQQILDIHPILHDMFFRWSLRAVFGLRCTAAMEAANEIVFRTSSAVNRHLRSRIGHRIEYFDRCDSPRPESWREQPGHHFDLLRRRREAIEMLTETVIESAQSNTGSHSPVRSLMALIGEEASTSPRIKSSLTGLLLASYENSASTCSWLLWLLASNESWQRRIREETAAWTQAPPSLQDIRDQLPALWGFLLETLRLYPPVWSLGRMAQSDVGLVGEMIPAGTTVLISPWLQHRHPAIWRRADEFDPSRYERDSMPDEGTYLPFGCGLHSCPGEPFALLSICSVVAHWLKTWHFSLPTQIAGSAPIGTSNRPISLGAILGLTLQPKGPVSIRVERVGHE